MKKIYNVPSVWDKDERCRVTTHDVGIPATVMYLVVLRFVLELTTCERSKLRTSEVVGYEVRTGRRIDDQQEGGHQREENNRRRKNSPCGPPLD